MGEKQGGREERDPPSRIIIAPVVLLFVPFVQFDDPRGFNFGFILFFAMCESISAARGEIVMKNAFLTTLRQTTNDEN